MRRVQIGVIGSAGPEEYPHQKPVERMYHAAEELGRILAKDDCIVINGGKGGIMEAVCRGANAVGGITVSETAGIQRFTSNDYTDVEIVTGDLAFRGPSQLVAMSDVLIALGGGAGTLQEICVAYRMCKPIILLLGYGGWVDRLSGEKYLDERKLVRFTVVDEISAAASEAIAVARKGQREVRERPDPARRS